MKNPLIKYGVTDTCLNQVKQLEDLDSGLASVSLWKPQHVSDEGSVSHYVSNCQQTAKLPTISFLNEFVEATDELVAAWKKDKQHPGLHDFDSAEPALFAVYAAFFEITDSMPKLFES
jgi:hypothetical protein